MRIAAPGHHGQGDIGHFERPNYYFGKLLTVRDFQAQQDYFNEKRWMLNRFATGAGVLNGLRVRVEPDLIAVVEPGTALDSYGHEIVVRDPCRVDIPHVLRERERECDPGPDPKRRYLVSLRYVECPVEPFQVPMEECDRGDGECRYDRTREKFRIEITREEEGGPHEEGQHRPDCETDCHPFLEDPGARINRPPPARPPCEAIPLALIHCRKDRWLVDNRIDPGQLEREGKRHATARRRVAFSSERLAELLFCLEGRMWKAHAARLDRKRHVPLLCQTIPGLEFVPGKDRMHAVGRQPTRLTTEGTYVWITDQAQASLHRIHRRTNSPALDGGIDLPKPAWGIAYDGKHMWVTHPGAGEGPLLSRVDVCTDKVEPAWELAGLRGRPKEICFDGRFLWVSHGMEDGPEDDRRNRSLWVSRIDPHTHEIVPVEIDVDKDERSLGGIAGMAFDGNNVWIAYSTRNPVARSIDARTLAVGQAIELRGRMAKDICFDGNDIWVAHNEGVSRIRREHGAGKGHGCKVDHSQARDNRQALAFDGASLWLAEVGTGEVKVERMDILTAAPGPTREIMEFHGNHGAEVGRMICDGEYIWIAGWLIQGKEGNKGYAYRLLP